MLGVGSILNNSLSSEGKKNDCYYTILGCAENATTEQIITEYKIRAFKLHPDKNLDDEKSLEEFQRLQEARNVLVDSEKRRLYDKWRHSDICIPFSKWVSMSDRMQTTMHWAKPKNQTMLEGGDGPSSPLKFKDFLIQKEEEFTMQKISQDFKEIRREFQKDYKTTHEKQCIYRQFRDYQI